MRDVIEAPEFANGVERLGGHRLIDEALSPIIDALSNNPYGFVKFENDWTSFRYARTQPIAGRLPALVIVFTIDKNKDVVSEWIDRIDETGV